MFSKLVPPALRRGSHPGRRWHVGTGIALVLAAGATLVARSRRRRPSAPASQQVVVDLTASGAAEDALEESTQTPIPVA
jgi:hypothetical protein